MCRGGRNPLIFYKKNSLIKIDFIGDIHGHADKLELLLTKLGYTYSNAAFSHPERKVLFVGDYIDRGPQINETLVIVKAMVDSGNAIALMGNHEYNALCFHFQEREGGHLRKHLIKNVIQHYETLKQFQNRQGDYEYYLEWFKTLPLYYETETFRAVHACWEGSQIDFLCNKLTDDRLSDESIYQSAEKGSPFNNAIEIVLKGKEIKMPAPLSFTDKDGTGRNEIRIKWWEDPLTTTFKDISIEPIADLPETIVGSATAENEFYKAYDKPVFFGHYWLKEKPILYRNNICCLDYSVAKKGHLVAYRFDGEQVLNEDKLVYV